MMASWVLVIMQAGATPTAVGPRPAPVPVAQPAPPRTSPAPPATTPLYAGQSQLGPQPPYAPGPQYGPPPLAPPDLNLLDQQYGAYYSAPKGKALSISGGITLAFAAPALLGSLVCLITGAALSDSGDAGSARILLYTAAGLGASGLLGTGGGAAMVILGRARKRRYQQWLLQRSGAAPSQIGWRTGLLLGPQRAGIAWTLRF